MVDYFIESMEKTNYITFVSEKSFLTKSTEIKSKKTFIMNTIKVQLISAFILLGLSILSAQTGTIQGYVYDNNHDPLPLVNLHVQELNKTMVSDADGHFEFKNLTSGEYTIQVSINGYKTITQKIAVKDGEISKLTLSLNRNSIALKEVVVTAERMENSLQKVPIAMNKINSQQIEQQKIVEMEDLSITVPNFIVTNVGSPALNVFAARGVTFPSADYSALGVYIDGVPMLSGYGSSIQLQDIKSIEILRGPQSTLYGRNALGGVIKIVTEEPKNYARGFVSLTEGNYHTQRYGAGISGPLLKNKLYAGFNGLYDSYKGYFKNRYNDKKFDHPQSYNGNAYLKYYANNRLKFILNAKAEKNEVTGAYPYSLYADALSNPRKVNMNGTNIEKRNFFTTSLLSQYKAKNFTLQSITGYTFRENENRDYDIDNTPADYLTLESLQQQKMLTQEFKIVTNQNKKLQFTGGLYGYYDWIKSPITFIYGVDAGDYAGNVSSSTNNVKLYGISAYGHLTYRIAPKWKAAAGLRFDKEKRKLISYMGLKEPDDATKRDGSNTALSPKISLSYQPKKDLMFYASYARGFNQGGFNAFNPNPDHYSYKPEYTNNYELGAKSEWLNHRLRANVSLFYIKWNDQQQTITDAATGGYTDNIGEMSSNGAELELTALPVKSLKISYNFGLTHTEYQTLILPDDNKVNKNYKGNHQVFTPVYNSALSLSYNTDIGKNLNLFIVPQWKLLGRQYFNYYNDLVQKPYSLLNLNIGLVYKNYELSLWGKNLTDEKYLSFGFVTVNAAKEPVLYGSNPRTIGFTLKANFSGRKSK